MQHLPQLIHNNFKDWTVCLYSQTPVLGFDGLPVGLLLSIDARVDLETYFRIDVDLVMIYN